MGTNVIVLGCKHRLSVAKPLELFSQLSEIFQANVIVKYYNRSYVKEPYIIEIGSFAHKNPIREVFVELPECPYLEKATQNQNETPIIDWNSQQLIDDLVCTLQKDRFYDITIKSDDELNEDYFYLYLDFVNIDGHVIGGCRWSYFTKGMVGECDEQYWEFLDQSRRETLMYVRLLGCEHAAYCPDQWEGEFIFVRVNHPYDDFMNYVQTKTYLKEYAENEKKYNPQYAISDEEMNEHIFLDLPTFMKNGRVPISKECCIDFITDDFSDLE